MTEHKMTYKNEDGEKILLCPNCGDAFLHQAKTEIFNIGEEESTGLHVTSYRGYCRKDIIIDKEFKDNPSPKRDGLKIEFFCEICSTVSVLEIYQHKGQTYIKFYQKK